MKNANISIFIPNNGCPYKCSFCDQKKITGVSLQPSVEGVKEIIEKAKNYMGQRSKYAEIAFFGGSFTLIDEKYMISLLNVASDYIKKGFFSGIRISTRPDAIDNNVLSILKEKNVTAIELGAQSMDNDVLYLNRRGHKEEDVILASELIKKAGFSLGLQMMTGLYGSSFCKDYNTALKLLSILPDTVRIYPTITMKNTLLQKFYDEGKYTPPSLDETVRLCAKLLNLFKNGNVNVIRLGLQDSPSLKANMIAGPWHPSLGELCYSYIFLKRILKKIEYTDFDCKKFIVWVNPCDLSKVLGQKRSNLKKFNDLGFDVEVKADEKILLDDFKVEVR